MLTEKVRLSAWIGHFAFTQWLNLNLGVFYYAIPLLVNAILLASLTYCRMHGFTLKHKRMAIAP